MVGYSHVLSKGFEIYSQLKVLHWQTRNNMHHQLFQDLYQQFDQKNDQLVEVLMGKLGKPIKLRTNSYMVQNINQVDIAGLFEGYAAFYQYLASLLEGKNNAANDIIYDIINLFRRKRYLFLQQRKRRKKGR